MYRIEQEDEQEGKTTMTLSSLQRWVEMVGMFRLANPHLSISAGGEVWKVKSDGSAVVSVRGTTLKMKLKKGDWSWEE